MAERANGCGHRVAARAAAPGVLVTPGAPPPQDMRAQLGVATAVGGAFSPQDAGPPLPPCETERAAYAEGLGLVGSPSTPELKTILDLLTGMTGTSMGFVALFGDRRIWVKAGLAFSVGDFPWRSRCAAPVVRRRARALHGLHVAAPAPCMRCPLGSLRPPRPMAQARPEPHAPPRVAAFVHGR
jgi:hypothetical protein